MDTEAERKRREVMNAYSSKQWRKRVLLMSDRQIVAIYLRLKKDGKI